MLLQTELFHSFLWLSNSHIVVEKSLESPLDYKEIKPDDPKGNQPWILIRRTDAEAKAPILWSPDAKSWLIKKDPDTGNDWSRRMRQRTRWLKAISNSMDKVWASSGYEQYEQSHLGDGEGQGSLACCSPWGRKDWTRLSGWTTIFIHTHPTSSLIHLSADNQVTSTSWLL